MCLQDFKVFTYHDPSIKGLLKQSLLFNPLNMLEILSQIRKVSKKKQMPAMLSLVVISLLLPYQGKRFFQEFWSLIFWHFVRFCSRCQGYLLQEDFYVWITKIIDYGNLIRELLKFINCDFFILKNFEWFNFNFFILLEFT